MLSVNKQLPTILLMNWQIQIIIFIPVWGLPLWFHRWAHRAAAGQSRLLGVETSQPCVDCWLHIGHHLTSSDMINGQTLKWYSGCPLSVCLYTVWEKKSPECVCWWESGAAGYVFRSRFWMFTVASLTRSAAEPWTVVFTAWRSAWMMEEVIKHGLNEKSHTF